MNQHRPQQITKPDKGQTRVGTGGAMTYIELDVHIASLLALKLHVAFWEDLSINSFFNYQNKVSL